MIENFKEKGGYLLVQSLIIIIGISITFSFNNWKTEIDNRKKEKIYLSKIINDLDTDLESLNSLLKFRKSQIEFISKYFQYKQQGKGFDNEELIDGMYQLYSVRKFSHNQINYEILISTGQLNLIRDDEIINNMAQLMWGNYYGSIEINNQDIFNFRNKYVLPYIYENYSFFDLLISKNYDAINVKDDKELNNILTYNLASISSSIQAYTQAIKYVEITKEKIVNYLNSKKHL